MESERDIHVQNEESNNVMDYGVSAEVPIAQAVAIDAPEPYVPHASNSMNNNNNQATVIDSSNVQQSPMVVAATAVPQAATPTTTTSYTVVRTTIMHARKVLFPSVSERQSKIFLTRFPSFWSC